jgi:hypothetical protein
VGFVHLLENMALGKSLEKPIKTGFPQPPYSMKGRFWGEQRTLDPGPRAIQAGPGKPAFAPA